MNEFSVVGLLLSKQGVFAGSKVIRGEAFLAATARLLME